MSKEARKFKKEDPKPFTDAQWNYIFKCLKNPNERQVKVIKKCIDAFRELPGSSDTREIRHDARVTDPDDPFSDDEWEFVFECLSDPPKDIIAIKDIAKKLTKFRTPADPIDPEDPDREVKFHEPNKQINPKALVDHLRTTSGERMVLQVEGEVLKLKSNQLTERIDSIQRNYKSVKSRGDKAHTKIDQLLKRVEELEQYREGEVAEFGDNEYVEDRDGRMVKKKWFEKTNVKHDFDDDVLTNGKRCIHIDDLRDGMRNMDDEIKALRTRDKKLTQQNAQLYTKLDLLTKRVDGLDERFEPARDDDPHTEIYDDKNEVWSDLD